MLQTNSRRIIAAGFIAASLLVSAPPAQAGPCLNCGGGSGGYTIPAAKRPWAPSIGTATSGVSGGPITATAAWIAPNNDPTNTEPITGYRVHANKVEPRFDAYTQQVWWVVVGTTTSAVQPATARTLSMALPQTGTYTFQVQAINKVGDSPYSAASNRVQGQ